MLTKTLEWNLNWCLLDTMLDHNFQIKEEFTHDVKRLQWRFRCSLCHILTPFDFVHGCWAPGIALMCLQCVAGPRAVNHSMHVQDESHVQPACARLLHCTDTCTLCDCAVVVTFLHMAIL